MQFVVVGIVGTIAVEVGTNVGLHFGFVVEVGTNVGVEVLARGEAVARSDVALARGETVVGSEVGFPVGVEVLARAGRSCGSFEGSFSC